MAFTSRSTTARRRRCRTGRRRSCPNNTHRLWRTFASWPKCWAEPSTADRPASHGGGGMCRLLCQIALALLVLGCEHTSLREPATKIGPPDPTFLDRDSRGTYHEPAPRTSPPDLTSLDKESWGRYVGETVRLRGVAQQCKMGAGITVTGEDIVYVDDLRSWPEDSFDKPVVVTGTLDIHPGWVPPENDR